MAIGRRVLSKSAGKRRDTKSEQTKTGFSPKTQSIKDNEAVIHQSKNTSRKAYSTKNSRRSDLKSR